MCCGEDNTMKYFINAMMAKETARNYAVAPEPIKLYAVTPVVFSRPLGINYISGGLSTPTDRYAFKTTYQKVQYQIPVEPPSNFGNLRTNDLNVKRDSLFMDIGKIKGGLYNNKLALYNQNVHYN